MEDNNRREENDEVTGDIRDDGTAGQQEKGSDYQYQLIPRSSSNFKPTRNETDSYPASRQHDRKSSRSRSRSRSKPSRRKQWRSANAFLNFMQDFRQDYNKIKSKDLFRLGGQKWRRMSSMDKMPYVEAAKLAQKQSQHSNKGGQQSKPNGSDSSKKPENQKDQKKKEREERKRSRSKIDDSDAESDSGTSGTGATMTSEDVSDLSS